MNAFSIVIAFFVGVGLAALYFAGLWWTIRQIVTTGQIRHLLISLALRVGILCWCFYIVMDGSWERMAACIGGFLLGRILFVQRNAAQAGSQAEVI